MTDRRKIAAAMSNPDRWVIRFRYLNARGESTCRMASPVRWSRSGDAFVALCLCREECRTFRVDRCSDMEMVESDKVLMPVAITLEN